MADQTDDSTTTPADEGLDPAALPEGGAPAAEELLQEAEAGEDDDAGEQAAAEEGPPAGEAAAATPEPEPEPDEAPVSPFGAQFSSPEPTAVIARPRRRATRPAGAADPGSYTPVAPAVPALPAFVSFVAPTETDVPTAPRRRSRRPEAESPGVEEAEVEPTEDLDEEVPAPRSRRSRSRRRAASEEAPAAAEDADTAESDEDRSDEDGTDAEDTDDNGSAASRRRRRGRRGRGRGRSGEDAADTEDEDSTDEESGDEQDADEDADADSGEDTAEGDEDEGGSSTRRRRRRRRRGTSAENGDAAAETDDDRPERAGRNGRTTSDDDVRGVTGSTRLEAKRQRRRDGRDNGRRRAPILTESEFLARREAVDRKMVIRQRGERTQIAVLEDDVLVEHYVTQAQATSFAGNVYLGRVQNVLPSMEAAFIDIGKGRNAVLYAGEVNWDAAGLSGKQRSIETAMKSGDKVLVQVTKDPIGHKGARLTQQVNLPGRFLVYVPGGSMTGISRKLPDTERQRLKDILKKIVPEDAGVIIRTAAEGASEEELTRDVARLQAQWDVIQKKADSSSNAPALLYGEPDLAIRVIRDVFNEDFKELVVQGDDAWDTVEAYVAHVSPELVGRLSRSTGEGDVFRDLRIDEQLAKALDRKVWLPSGGSLVIDRTEAMTVVDVNTGKFTGSGGNLEQTVTRNNMEAAEEIVRQLRLRDIGGIIVIDFIDMVLESNRDLVLRRLTECLGRDRTKHQVAEVTSLGLVQMTRKRVGQGLLEVFSEPCEHCRGRGVIVNTDPVDEKRRGGGNAPSGNGGGKPREQQRAEKARDNGARLAEDAEPAVEAPGEDGADGEGQRSGGGRRSRGRRNRGQSGEERAAEDAAVLAAAGGRSEDTAAEDTAAEDTAAEDTAVADAVPDGPADEPDQPDAVVPEPAPEPAGEPTPPGPAPADQALAEPSLAEPVDRALSTGTGATGRDDEEAVPAGAGPDDPGPMDVEPDDAEPAAAGGPVAGAQPPATDDAGEPSAPVTRPRRRRAASRPAGPPAS
ncbi:Rne/Rng family ribonuclease [Geodermatophilus sp. DSM 45219]|uniref:Rne/Rng family ribonuclease n=1 Tax=Geodermatophilus sp. DSM 45219 TaxID=1881103 RepID=UPI00088F72E2|nr:Rne/Rng family ribonuclease [Geodermatophilus sp. DSM 45219]SDO17341.1 ribonuclease E [Geodermatophilus sp. DSM 45219]